MFQRVEAVLPEAFHTIKVIMFFSHFLVNPSLIVLVTVTELFRVGECSLQSYSASREPCSGNNLEVVHVSCVLCLQYVGQLATRGRLMNLPLP